MFCRVLSADICGIDAFSISVEADVSTGLPCFNMVGLPSSEVREAKERVERAIINSGVQFPVRKITINLSPANIRKQGSGFDLPIAVAVLAAAGIIRMDAVEGTMFAGELSLDGSVNKIRGVLAIALLAKEKGIRQIVVPKGNAFEGSVVDGVRIHGATSLKELIHQLNRMDLGDVEHVDIDAMLENSDEMNSLDFCDINGQEKAKRATMIATAGFHNILYVGPPGAGKSMMAKRIPTIFGRMTRSECLEVSKIYSVAGLLNESTLKMERPFRDPHQSITEAAMIGGGANPWPGEVTLAHKGVLFLDELTEFKRSVIEDLRLPMENREIVISRSNNQVRFPCDVMVVAATNPCPCGFFPDRNICSCSSADISRYMSKIRGPVLDRIDICVGVSRVDAEKIGIRNDEMSTATLRESVLAAREIQKERFKGTGIDFNSQMGQQEIEEFCSLDREAEKMLKNAYERHHLTARGYYKILKTARTVADVAGSELIQAEHMLEAIGYRNSFIN